MNNNALRQTNIEVLRVFSMFLIVVMHYIFCGLKQNPLHEFYDMTTVLGGVNYATMEPLYLLSQVAVNCYVMITGYFLIDRQQFRWGGIIKTIIQTIFYSILFLMGAVLLKYDIPTSLLLKSFFPVHQWGYWFVTVYIGLLLVAPLLSRIAISLNKKQYQIVITVLFVLTFQQLYGSVYAGHRTIMFFSFLFLLAGYLKLYGIPQWIIKRKKYLFWGLWFLLFVFATVINAKKGCFELIGTSYDGPILFLSLMTFVLFLDAKMDSKFYELIAKLAPYTFGVYLIHTNCFVNERLWGLLPSNFNVPIFVHCLIFCIVVFAVCVIFDFFRAKLFDITSFNKLLSSLANKIPQL